MNKVISGLVIGLITSTLAMTSVAAPSQDQKAPPKQGMKQDQKAQPSNNMVKPSRDWKVGTKVPKQYQAKKFHVTDKSDKRLSKPGKSQQWLKINGDYVLTNGTTYSIVKIIRG